MPYALPSTSNLSPAAIHEKDIGIRPKDQLEWFVVSPSSPFLHLIFYSPSQAKFFFRFRSSPPLCVEAATAFEWVLTAEECLKYGVCDKIIEDISELI
jgi:hypothetical protein